MTNRDRIRSSSEADILFMMDKHLDEQYKINPDDIGCILRILTNDCQCKDDYPNCRTCIVAWLDKEYDGKW